MVQTCRKLWFPQLAVPVSSFTCPLLCTISWRLFRAVYTGTRPWLTPAIRAGKGWRGRRELAPRCSATQLAARRHAPGQTRRVLNDSYHTHHHHTTTLHHTAPHCTHTHTLHTTHFTPHTSHHTLHTTHFTPHTSHHTLHTSHFTLHTSHFTLHTSLFTTLHHTTPHHYHYHYHYHNHHSTVHNKQNHAPHTQHTTPQQHKQ